MATTSPTHPDLRHSIEVARPAGALRLVRLWHLTSLDAPTVAVSWAFAFAWAARIHLPIWLPIVLALAAWSFYIADRLFDARRCFSVRLSGLPPDRSPLRPRHYFHWEHRRIFSAVAFAAALVAVGLVLHSMPLAARERNSVLAVAALVYFTSVHSPWRAAVPKLRLKIPKELLVALIFTLACAVPTLGRLNGQYASLGRLDRWQLLGPVPIFIALAWLNCHAIDTWESSTARRGRLRRLAVGLAGAALLAAAIEGFLLHQPRVTALMASAAVSAGLLGLLDHMDGGQRRFHPTTLRAAVDLALLAPLALFVVR